MKGRRRNLFLDVAITPKKISMVWWRYKNICTSETHFLFIFIPAFRWGQNSAEISIGEYDGGHQGPHVEQQTHPAGADLHPNCRPLAGCGVICLRTVRNMEHTAKPPGYNVTVSYHCLPEGCRSRHAGFSTRYWHSELVISKDVVPSHHQGQQCVNENVFMKALPLGMLTWYMKKASCLNATVKLEVSLSD